MDPVRVRHRLGLAFMAVAALLTSGVGMSYAAPAQEPFPQSAPANRGQAETLLSAGDDLTIDSLSVRIANLLSGATSSPAQSVRAARTLRTVSPRLRTDGAVMLPGAVPLTFTTDRNSFDAIDPADEDGDGLPDALAALDRGWTAARALLHDELGLPLPAGLTVTVARIGADASGYVIPASSISGPRIVLDPAPVGGTDALERATVRETAFATALAAHPGIDPAWADAFGRWATLRALAADDDTIALLAERRDRWNEGLSTDDERLAAGNALWFAWLDEAIGPVAITITLEELGRADPVESGLDRAVSRAAGMTLAGAMRDLQTWSLLTGERFDGRHFSFAGRMPDPAFAGEADWLPAISVQSDAPIAALGGSAFRIAPERERGGMTVRFEGGFDASWSADLLLRLDDGVLHRVALVLEAGRGEATIPLDGLAEAVLLVRNDSPTSTVPARFTWTAHAVRGFPFTLTRMDAAPQTGQPSGVLLSWETASETRLVGFNLLRTPVDGGLTRRVNPVWIPAIGDPADGAAYRFLDATAEPGRPYVYRLEGLTLDGLRTVADPVTGRAPAARD